MTITIIDISPGATVVISDGYIADSSITQVNKEMPINNEPTLSEIITEDTDSPQPLTEDQINDLHNKYRL